MLQINKLSQDKADWIAKGFAIGVFVLMGLRVALYIFFVASGGLYIHPDSAIYLELATGLLDNGTLFLPQAQPVVIEPFGVLSENAGRVMQSNPPPGPEVFRTPGYPFFLAALCWLGISNPYALVLCQELIYVLTVFIFYKYGRSLLGEHITRLGVIFMLLESGGLVWPKYLISESLFLPFLLIGMLAVGYYLKKVHWQYLLLAGAAWGVGAIIRPAILLFPIVVALTLILFAIGNRQRWLHAGVLLFSFMLLISPWLVRNYSHYDKIFISGQGSNMLANYHVPMVWNWEGIIPYYEGQTLVQEKISEVVKKKEQQLGRSLDTVEYYQLQQQYAVSELSKYPETYLIHWFNGSFKTMYESFIIDLYQALRVPDTRLHFYEVMAKNVVPGRADLFDVETSGLITNIGYYFINQDKVYLIYSVSAFLVFIFALAGALKILLSRNCYLFLILLANCYFIFLPGPMGYARFRFPVDVFWFIQAYIGFMWCSALLQKAWRRSRQFWHNKSLVEMDADA